MAETDEILELVKKGRANYSWFMTHALDVNPKHLWDKMVEVSNSVRDNERTSVGAGHGVGRLALCFLTCYYPSTVILGSFPNLNKTQHFSGSP